MDIPLTIPVLVKTEDSQSIGGPASVADTVRLSIQEAVSSILIDEASLDQSVQAIQMLTQYVKVKLNNTQIRADTISFQLGISATGKVGFLGNGVDIQLATTLQLTLKIQSSES